MAARALALLAAVAMVVAAVVVRGRIDDGGAAGSGGGKPRLVCATELEAVCTALAAGGKVEVTVEPAATTADTLSKVGPGEEPPLDGWLVTAPWPDIVNQNRQRSGAAAVVSAGPVLARSPAVLAVRGDRKAALDKACGGTAGWKCLGDVAGRSWSDLGGGGGQVTPGHPPAGEAAGLTVLGAALAGFFGTTDLSRENLDDPGFRAWLDRLERAAPGSDGSPIATMAVRPSAYDAVGAIEAEAGPLVATARDPKPVLLYPDPVATADVVLATTTRGGGPAVSSLVSGTGRSLLAGNGWRVPAHPLAPGLRADLKLPAASNLPDPGVLEALRRRVEQAR
ncbi:MAG TPA: hypothetical protein VFJ85_06825 [Acidimicrobiales bacterium]|nr:hypothetical protein [Acidimicrobiales bacterium]